MSNMYLFTKNDIAQTNLMQNISFTKLILFLILITSSMCFLAHLMVDSVWGQCHAHEVSDLL